MKRNKKELKPETEKSVRFAVEKNVLEEYLWGHSDSATQQAPTTCASLTDEVPDHTKLLSAHFDRTFSPCHIRIKLAEVLQVIKDEREHIRKRKFSVCIDGSIKFKKDKRRAYIHIVREIKEIIACLRVYVAKHSTEVESQRSQLHDSTSTALGLFSLSFEMENIRKQVVAGDHELRPSIETEEESMERIQNYRGSIIPPEELTQVEEHLHALHDLFLVRAGKWTDDSPVEAILEADAEFDDYLIKSCFISSLEHFIDEFSEYDDAINDSDLHLICPLAAPPPQDEDVPYCEPMEASIGVTCSSIAECEVVSVDYGAFVNIASIIEKAVKNVTTEILERRQQQQEYESQQQNLQQSDEQECVASCIADTVVIPALPDSQLEEPPIDETPSSDENEMQVLSLPISFPQMPLEHIVPIAASLPLTSPRPIQMRGSFIPTKHSPAKPLYDIYRVTTNVNSEKSNVLMPIFSDATSASQVPTPEDIKQTVLHSAHIDSSQLTHAPPTQMFQKGRKLKARIPSYMKGVLCKELEPRKQLTSFTQARAEDIAIDVTRQLLIYSSVTGQSVILPLTDVLPTQSRFANMVTLRTRDHQYITCIQATEWRHILTLLEHHQRDTSPTRQAPVISDVRSQTAPHTARSNAYARHHYRYEKPHTLVTDHALPILPPSDDLHKRPFLVSRHVKTAGAAAGGSLDDGSHMLVQPAPVPPKSPQRGATAQTTKRPVTTHTAKRPRTEPRSNRAPRPGTTQRQRKRRDVLVSLEDSVDLSLDSS